MTAEPPRTEGRRRGAGAGRDGNGRRGGDSLSAAEMRELARNRLIESRLTPNAISIAGQIGNVVAAVLVWQR